MSARAGRGLVLAPIVALLACSSGSTARLDVTVAPVASEGVCPIPVPSFQAPVACARVTACAPQPDEGCEPIAVVLSSAAHGTGPAEGGGFVPLTSSRSIKVDLRQPGAAVRLTVELFDSDGQLLAWGRTLTSGVRDGGRVAVRLFRPGQWSCGGPLAASRGAAPLPGRALHAQVRLDNGQVLIFGGIFGEHIPLGSLGLGASLRRSVEVYDPQTDQFFPVTVRDETTERAEGEGFARALFAATAMGESGGEYRVRVSGGVRTGDERAAIVFDGTRALTYYGLPFTPARDAELAGTVDLMYEPKARVVRITDASPVIPRPAAWGAVSTGPARCNRLLLAGFSGAPDASSLRVGLDRSYAWMPTDASGCEAIGTPPAGMLMTARLGMSVTGVSQAEDVALVWGGNVDEAPAGTADEETRLLRAHAGEILARSGSGYVAGDTLPAPTVFHTATALQGDRVLLAGGYPVGLPSTMQRTTTHIVEPPLSVLSVARGAGGMTVTSETTDWSGYVGTALHTATVLVTGGGHPTLVLLAGGNPSAMDMRLGATAATGIVTDRGASTVAHSPGATLQFARWGHAATLLDREDDGERFHRVLVTGGLAQQPDATMRIVDAPEVLLIPDPAVPGDPPLMGCMPPDTMGPEDAGPAPMDSGAPAPVEAGGAGG